MAKKRYRMEIYAKRVYQICPIYHEGDKMVFIEPALIPEETDAVCFSAMADIIPYYRALCRGVSAKKMGLREEDGEPIIECHDPCGLYPQYPTDGGSVAFAVRRIPITEEEHRKAIARVPYTLEEVQKIHEERRRKWEETQK